MGFEFEKGLDYMTLNRMIGGGWVIDLRVDDTRAPLVEFHD